MVPISESSLLKRPPRRGGVWGALALVPVFIITGVIMGSTLLGDDGERGFSGAVWISASISGLTGAFLGFRLSVRVVLMIVSALFSAAMFFDIFEQITMKTGSEWPETVEVALCALCSFPAFCLLLAKQALQKPPFPSCLFWLFLVNALLFTVYVGVEVRDVFLIMISFPLFVMPFWASAVLAWRLRKDLLVPLRLSGVPMDGSSQTNSEDDAPVTPPVS